MNNEDKEILKNHLSDKCKGYATHCPRCSHPGYLYDVEEVVISTHPKDGSVEGYWTYQVKPRHIVIISCSHCGFTEFWNSNLIYGERDVVKNAN